jgi:signal transduction histidine kinase
MNLRRSNIRRKWRRWWLRQRHPDAEERERQRQRILFVERRVMWPIKLVVMLLAYLLWRQLILHEGQLAPPGKDPQEVQQAVRLFSTLLMMYLTGNLAFAMPLLLAWQAHFGPTVVRWCAFLSAVLDNLFLSALIYITEAVNPLQTGGLNSVLYWLYCGVMVRNAIYFPVILQQALINLSVIGSYTLSLFLAYESWDFISTELFRLRISVLVLVGICCWGIYLLLERQRRRDRDRHEFLLRSEKMRATGQLAAEIAHQLKNPLSIINNAAFNLQRSLDRGKPLEPSSVQIIRAEVQRADKILSDLLNYSGVSEDKIESVDVNQIIEHVLALRLPMPPDSRITVRKELEEGLPPLYAQRRWIEESILNLVVNSIEAMPDGGTLTVRTNTDAVGNIVVQVQDTGSGVAESDRDKIFEPFYTTKHRGSGLGLSIVKNVAEACGGRVYVQPADPKRPGAVFVLELPLHTGKLSQW